MEKHLTETGVWIGFDSALSDPALCTGLCDCVSEDMETHVPLVLPNQNTVEANDWKFRLPTFLLTV